MSSTEPARDAAYPLSDRIDLLIAEVEAVTDHTRDVNERLQRGETVTFQTGPYVRPFMERAIELLRECQEQLGGTTVAAGRPS